MIILGVYIHEKCVGSLSLSLLGSSLIANETLAQASVQKNEQISQLEKAMKAVKRKYTVYARCLNKKCTPAELSEAKKDFITGIKVVGAAIVAVGVGYGLKRLYTGHQNAKRHAAIQARTQDHITNKKKTYDAIMELSVGKQQEDQVVAAEKCFKDAMVREKNIILVRYLLNKCGNLYKPTSQELQAALTSSDIPNLLGVNSPFMCAVVGDTSPEIKKAVFDYYLLPMAVKELNDLKTIITTRFGQPYQSNIISKIDPYINKKMFTHVTKYVPELQKDKYRDVIPLISEYL